MNLAKIQEELQRQGLGGWLFFDHHGRDPIAYRILGLGEAGHVTRRWYYFIPAHGEPKALVHRIERDKLNKVPGDKLQYAGWQEHTAALRQLLSGVVSVAMQYSPLCEIPYIAMVDAGTIELVRSTGCEIRSSAELVQRFEATLTPEALESHLEAGRRVDSVRAEAFRFLAERTGSETFVTEFELAEWIRNQFALKRLRCDNGPIVGVNGNSGDPHYEPLANQSAFIQRGDFVLLDMWARLDQEDSVYYDITWTGFCGRNIPESISHIFNIVKDARDSAINRVRAAVERREEVRGFQVDDAARNFIQAQGFGERFLHRTGHSIGTDIHGSGANMDNFETHDERELIPWTCFSIEPGIYLDTFGIRSEVDMFITDSSAFVTGEIQTELVQII